LRAANVHHDLKLLFSFTLSINKTIPSFSFNAVPLTYRPQVDIAHKTDFGNTKHPIQNSKLNPIIRTLVMG
jgi:hypothetical protein